MTWENAPDYIKKEPLFQITDVTINTINDDTGNLIISNMNYLLDRITDLGNSFTAYCYKVMPKSQSESHDEYKKAVKAYKAWADKGIVLVNAITNLGSKKRRLTYPLLALGRVEVLSCGFLQIFFCFFKERYN
jgi:hydroxyethylthiazole kinase-like sugar kinase family protein